MLEIQVKAAATIFEAEHGTQNGRYFAILIPQDDDLCSGICEKLDHRTNGALRRAAEISRFKGERDQSCTLIAPCPDIAQIVLVGYGEEANLTPNRVENAAALAASLCKKAESVSMAFVGRAETFAAHAAYGATLGQYRFSRYKHDAELAASLRKLDLFVEDIDATTKQWARLQSIALGVFRTRDLVNEPGNILHPPEFAKRIETLRDIGVSVTILTASTLQELGFGALLGVAQGSDKEAHVAIMHYAHSDNQNDAPIALIGKGVTFDSGGISIKSANGMEEMKTDMGGAAAVVGAIEALARRHARANVVGVVGLVENMLSGNAQRPGDIVTSYAGKTIEVLNTDAEGRLVLADVLAYTRNVYRPQLMIDLATLTGAIVISLGHEYAGVFSNNETLKTRLVSAGETSGDAVWPMPMGPAYDREIDSPIADMKNIGSRVGGSITAAQFLARFVGDTPWAHIDIAGVAARNDAAPTCPKGASGFGVRLLDQLIYLYESGENLI